MERVKAMTPPFAAEYAWIACNPMSPLSGSDIDDAPAASRLHYRDNGVGTVAGALECDC